MRNLFDKLMQEELVKIDNRRQADHKAQNNIKRFQHSARLSSVSQNQKKHTRHPPSFFLEHKKIRPLERVVVRKCTSSDQKTVS